MCTCYRRRRRSQVFVNAISQNPLVRIIRDFVCRHKPAWSRNENALVAVRRISRKWWPLLSKKNCESDISRTAVLWKRYLKIRWSKSLMICMEALTDLAAKWEGFSHMQFSDFQENGSHCFFLEFLWMRFYRTASLNHNYMYMHTLTRLATWWKNICCVYYFKTFER